MAGWIKAKQPGVRVLMMTGKREIDPAVAPHFAAVIVGVAFRESRVKHLGGEDLVVLERALQKTETGGMAHRTAKPSEYCHRSLPHIAYPDSQQDVTIDRTILQENVLPILELNGSSIPAGDDRGSNEGIRGHERSIHEGGTHHSIESSAPQRFPESTSSRHAGSYDGTDPPRLGR